MHLLALPQEDVLFPHIFSHMSVSCLFLLRGTCQAMKDAVDVYWGQLKSLNLAGNNRINRHAVQVSGCRFQLNLAGKQFSEI